MGSTELTTAMGSSSTVESGSALSEEYDFTLAMLPKSMTRLSNTHRPVQVWPPGKVSPVTR